MMGSAELIAACLAKCRPQAAVAAAPLAAPAGAVAVEDEPMRVAGDRTRKRKERSSVGAQSLEAAPLVAAAAAAAAEEEESSATADDAGRALRFEVRRANAHRRDLRVFKEGAPQVISRALRLMCEHTNAEHASSVVWPVLRVEIDASLAAAAEVVAGPAPVTERPVAAAAVASKKRRRGSTAGTAGEDAGVAVAAPSDSGCAPLAVALRRHAGRVASIMAEWIVIERGSRVTPAVAGLVGATLEALMAPALWARAHVDYRRNVMQVHARALARCYCYCCCCCCWCCCCGVWFRRCGIMKR
jgi:hypothetical protein